MTDVAGVPTAVHLVSRQAVRGFAAAVGASDPVHHDVEAARAAGHADLLAPPTFPVVVALPAVREVCVDGLVLHREQHLVHHRPMVAGDRLLVRTDTSTTELRDGTRLLRAAVEMSTVDGEPVCTSRSTLLLPTSARWPIGRVATNPAGAARFTVRRPDLVRYAAASGDHNPVHLDDLAARRAGLPTVVAHGMLCMALAARAVPGTISAYRARFTRPVSVGAAGATVAVATRREGRRWQVTATQDGNPVLDGIVEVRP